MIGNVNLLDEDGKVIGSFDSNKWSPIESSSLKMVALDPTPCFIILFETRGLSAQLASDVLRVYPKSLVVNVSRIN